MDRKSLLEKELNSFLLRVKEKYDPERVILFGSAASGQVKEQSDLDLVVVAETRDDFWSRLKKMAPLCSRRVGMDVLLYTPQEYQRLLEKRSFFRREVDAKGKVLYAKN